MCSFVHYDITIWEQIRRPVKEKTDALVETIKSEIAKDDSLREFQGEYPVPWQLTQIIQQRADHWLERLYDLSCEVYASRGNKVSQQFDRALWAYHIEPFIMREVAVNEYPYHASVLFELLLRAVGSPPGKRNQLKVGQKDCCLDIRNKIHQMWHDNLHHMAPRIELAAAMMRAQNQAAMTIPVELPSQPAEASSRPKAPGPQVPTVKSTVETVAPQPETKVPSGVGKTTVQDPPVPPPLSPVAPKEWSDIEISYLSDERVQIRIGRKLETLNYAEFGFQDGRTQNPVMAWRTLRRLAELGGTIRNEREAQESWPKVEKRVQEIRSILRNHFSISSDPIPLVESGGYKASFKITCSHSYNS
jgi:hypothetical protein